MTADGSRVVLAGNDERVRVYDARAGGTPQLELPLNDVVGHRSRVSAAAFSRDGRTLATGADNGSVLVWDGRTGEIVPAAKLPAARAAARPGHDTGDVDGK